MQLFISDLHLCQTRPSTTAAYRHFMRGPALSAQTLWILGDFYEYWAGDDDLETAFNAEVAKELKLVHSAGVQIRMIVGNRDFLIGKRFSEETGVIIENEPVITQVSGQPTLLMHGDALCTDDMAYQQFRAMVRNPAWQAQFLAQPLAVRKKIAEDLRAKSEMSKQEKAAEIMDVNDGAVRACFMSRDVQRIIHGHTHRPGRHAYDINGKACERVVLPDWHDEAVWLQADGSGISEHRLAP